MLGFFYKKGPGTLCKDVAYKTLRPYKSTNAALQVWTVIEKKCTFVVDAGNLHVSMGLISDIA